MVSSRPPNLQKTEEKLKNPQEPHTQALESQEGLKLWLVHLVGVAVDIRLLESQEGLKQNFSPSKRGRKKKGATRISRRVETYTEPHGGASHSSLLESQEGLKRHPILEL